FVGLTMSGIARRAFLPQVQGVTSGPVRRLDARFACERRMLDSGVRFTLHSDAGVRWTPIDPFALGLGAPAGGVRPPPPGGGTAGWRGGGGGGAGGSGWRTVGCCARAGAPTCWWWKETR